MKDIKVALVAFGMGEYCARLATAISRDRATRTMLCLPVPQVAPYAHLISPSVELHPFEMPRIRQPLKQLQMVSQLVQQIRKFNPDLIHVQVGQLWFNLALHLFADRPLVLTVHDALLHPGDGESRLVPQWAYDNLCHRAQQRIVHAPQIKDVLLRRLRISPESVHVIPHIMIGETNSDTSDVVSGSEPLILFFGRIWKYKGLEYLIRAEPLIASRIPQARIVIAGRGENFDRYRKMMINPDHFVIHNDYISDKTRTDLFREASIVVLPYIEASQSGVIPIAYSFAKPVVATAVGGLPNMVEDGRTGRLVPPRDSNALAEAIIQLLQNEHLRKRMGENGQRKVRSECAPEVVGEMTQAVYRLAIKDQSLYGCRVDGIDLARS